MRTLFATIVGVMAEHRGTLIRMRPACTCGLVFGYHRNIADLSEEHMATVMHEALTAREDEIADGLRAAGANLGAMPEFVAEVICQLGLGTEPDPETRSIIHSQFHVGLARLQEMLNQQRPDEGQ